MVNDFDSDTHRRVAANLSQPRSARDLARFLARHDPYVDEATHSEEGVVLYLMDLEEEIESGGLVKRIGSFDSGEALVKAVKADTQTVTLPKEKAEVLVERAEHSQRFPFVDEDHWALTTAGLERLTGAAPTL
jgi:hypothetical protein